MHIALIGSGNTATVLGRIIKQAGHTITGVYSKTLDHASSLAAELNAQHFGGIENITPNAELYIVAVTDDMINEISAKIRLPEKIIVHTSGSAPKKALENISQKYGVLYPLQSLRKEAKHQPVIPFLIDGSDTLVTQQVKELAESISSIVEEAGDDKRLKLHLAAVMVSNFTNHLYSLTENFCAAENVPFKALVPLIREVAERTAQYHPSAMQTGPAIRGDGSTIEKHLQLLTAYPLQRDVYETITGSIREFYDTNNK